MNIIKKEVIKSTKGNLSAAIHYPRQETEKLAIICSGFLDTKDYPSLIELANRLAERGYTAVRFDPTGVWKSEGSIADYTTTQYLADVKSVLEHMLAGKKYTEILLGGHSRGGMVSILYTARDSRISKVFSIMSPVGLASGEEWNTAGMRYSKRDDPNGGDDVEFEIPISYLEDLNKYNVLKEVTKVKIPILLLAGELDAGITPVDVENLYEQANDPKIFEVIPNIGHDYRLHKEQVGVVNNYILRWLDAV